MPYVADFGHAYPLNDQQQSAWSHQPHGMVRGVEDIGRGQDVCRQTTIAKD
jgi:hypothetical protein